MLPRLPDTADKLKSIALALQADPSKVLKLVKNAHEDAVKTMVLSGFSVLAFCDTWPGTWGGGVNVDLPEWPGRTSTRPDSMLTCALACQRIANRG